MITWDEIKKQYPNRFVILCKPVYDTVANYPKAAERVVASAKSYKKIKKLLLKMTDCDHFVIEYTGKPIIPENAVIVL